MRIKQLVHNIVTYKPDPASFNKYEREIRCNGCDGYNMVHRKFGRVFSGAIISVFDVAVYSKKSVTNVTYE